ncbi:MAG TPA: transcription elongation factor GreA [Alphaproteobacteria bacterium]|nr:transcription elongation factor GreA [Alphaproteobacteria bacterium]
MQKLPMTKRGAERLQKELNNLKNVERPAIIAAIAEAREHGDLSENAEYHAAREKQSFIEGRIQELEYAVSCAEVIDTSLLKNDAIVFGATVVLMNEDTEEEKTYQIVGQYEADLDHGLISVLSPMARALIGKSEGDDVQIASKSYEILEVKYV